MRRHTDLRRHTPLDTRSQLRRRKELRRKAALDTVRTHEGRAACEIGRALTEVAA